MGKVLHISIDKLRVHPDNTKYFHDIEGELWDCFKDNVAKHGILQPLLVVEDEDGLYTVLSGHQRLRVAKALGWLRAPCVVWDGEENRKDIIFSANLGRQLTTMERYRLTMHLLEQMEDKRETREKDEKGLFLAVSTHSGNSARNGINPRDRVATMVPGLTTKDITVFRKINELPHPVQLELFKFVEKHNPNKRELKEKVNRLNADRRRLKAELRAEKKLKLKKKELEELEEYVQTDIDPRSKYDARCFDETGSAVNRACVEIPRLIAEVLSFNTLRERTAQMLQPSIDALSAMLLDQRRLLLERWENRDGSLAQVDEYNDALEADI